MPEIGIEFDCSEEESESRVDGEGIGEVTDDGNYYREEEVGVKLFGHLREIAENDPEATITRVAM